MSRTVSRNPLAGIKSPKMRPLRIDAASVGRRLSHDAAVPSQAPGERLFFWLGQAAREAREEAGLRPEVIATRIDKGKETVTRFERGQTRPQELELMLAAYAECVGLADPRDLVVTAVRKWYEHGSPPTLTESDESDPVLPDPLPGALDPPTTPEAPGEDETGEAESGQAID